MHKNEVTSPTPQPLLLEVVVRPVHGHVWHSLMTWNPEPTRLPGSCFSRTLQASNNGWPMEQVILLFCITYRQQMFICSSSCLPEKMCLQLNEPFSLKLVVLLFSLAISVSDVYILFAFNLLFGPAMNKLKV